MDPRGQTAKRGAAPGDLTTEPGPAVRDAATILARAAEDDTAADEARERYRTERMAELEPDARASALLGPGEHLLAVRHSVMFDRRHAPPDSDLSIGLAGDLYLTTRRLVLVGRATLSFDLDEIDETVLSGDRLLLVMRDGVGVSLGVAWPRLLRVEIAAARAQLRG